MSKRPLNNLPLFILAGLILLTFSPITVAQQWQLGHQPSRYTVPQYNPAGGSYPLGQQPSSDLQEPRQHIPASSLPTLGSTSPGSTFQSPEESKLPNPHLSYPLKARNSQTEPQQEETPAPHDSQPLLQPPTVHDPPLPAQIDAGQTTPSQPQMIPLSHVPATPSVPPVGQANAKQGRYSLDYSIYRDLNAYPIDPRKPCNECIRPRIDEVCKCQWPGKNGRPYKDREPGTCNCSTASNKNRPNFSYNWPGPFSAIRDAHESCNSNCSPSKRINDRFDHLASFKLIDYKRTDNGYCGPGSDPYGCLGESRVAGVDFRQPGDSAVQRR